MNFGPLQTLFEQRPLFFFALMIWIMVWKGVALWKASQRGDKSWFVAILVLNTLGILDIIYYYFVGKKEEHIEHAEDNETPTV
jgi:methionyl-tRNA synthetase